MALTNVFTKLYQQQSNFEKRYVTLPAPGKFSYVSFSQGCQTIGNTGSPVKFEFQ